MNNMEKYIINKEEFKLYYSMLQSKEISIVKEGTQKFSDAFTKGRRILSSDVDFFCGKLEHLLNNKKYSIIHKWVYKCTCFYSNNKIEEICKKNFFSTNDIETLNWIISTISSRYYEYEEFRQVINAMRKKAFTDNQLIVLENKNLYYNVSIFGHFDIPYDTKNISDKIFREDDINGMYWMAKILAYSELSKRKGLLSLVKKEDVDMLTYSNISEIQVYAYWGLAHRKGGRLYLSHEETKDITIDKDSLKWYFAGIIPGEYVRTNKDFITFILESINDRFRYNIRAKEGILIGLNTIPYDTYYDAPIIQWYYNENYEKIKIQLLEYFIKNVVNNSNEEIIYNGNGSFFAVIQDESGNITYRNYIKKFIDVYKTLIYKILHGKVVIEMIKENDFMAKNQFQGCNINGIIITENHGDIMLEQKYINNKEAFLKNLEIFIDNCEDQKLVEEGKNALKSLKGNSEDLKNRLSILGNDLANFVTIASASPFVIEIAQKLLQYIKDIF